MVDYLNMNTLIINYIFISYICALIIIQLWISYGQTFKCLKFFVIDFIFQSTGLTLAIFTKNLHPAISIILPNFLMFSGIFFFLFGMACFLDINVNKKPYYIYIGGFTGLYTYYTVISPDITVRIILFSALTIPFFCNAVYWIFFKSYSKLRKYALGVGYICIFFIVVNILRIFYAVTGGTIQNYFYTPILDVFFVMLSEGLTVLLAFLLELMIINNLFDQADEAAAERESLLKTTKLMAVTDSLTGIYNRRKIEEILTSKIEKLRYSKVPFSVLLADIDHFKKINDTYGHQVGDLALVDVTQILEKNIRNTDYLGRWGGEEFLMILPKIKLNKALETAERLRVTMMEYDADYLKNGDKITLSIGVLESRQNTDIKSIVKGVDELLYRAKNNGRNRIEF